ncbi:MAG TPA: hypothetical protein VF798_09700 [Burkholderiaceae bacterium]
MTQDNQPAGMQPAGAAADEVPDFRLGSRYRWLGAAVVVLLGMSCLAYYIHYTTSRYDLPKLKPYAGAQEDLFAQMKCLVAYTETGKPTPGVACRFLRNYDSFWLSPRSLDQCLTYSTDTAVKAFDSPRRVEFDFMCEGNDMRAVFPYQNGRYQLQEIGMTFRQ